MEEKENVMQMVVKLDKHIGNQHRALILQP